MRCLVKLILTGAVLNAITISLLHAACTLRVRTVRYTLTDQPVVADSTECSCLNSCSYLSEVNYMFRLKCIAAISVLRKQAGKIHSCLDVDFSF